MKEIIKKEASSRYRGLSALAKKLGCSHTHLRRVLESERTCGPDLRKRLERLGVKFDAKGYAVKVG